jgi:RecJ-like exonuclease
MRRQAAASRSPHPGAPRDEVASRGGAAITELGGVLEHDSRTVDGRRVEVHDVDVERIESPTVFWIRDGNARVAVVTAEGASSVLPGQTVNVTGVVERAGDTVRIRASHVEGSR